MYTRNFERSRLTGKVFGRFGIRKDEESILLSKT